VHSLYWFALPGLAGGIRLLRDPDAEDDDREWLRGGVPVNSHAPRRLLHAAEACPLNGLAGVAVAGRAAAGELAAPRPPRGFRSLPQHRKSLAVVRIAIPRGISATGPDTASSRRNVAGIRTEFVPLGGPAVITERRR
jgi:hypothetical protein